MNISRIALLSVFFSAPMFAVDTTAATTTAATTSTATTSYSTMAKNFVAAPFVFALATAPDFIADKSYLNTLIAKITTISCLKDTFVNNPEMIGRAVVLGASAIAAYKLYTMYNADDAVDTEEDFFSEDDAS